jgi:Holliday junction resolvasome RuvABC ATP-dependent DNA helicase subunit
MFLNNVIGQKRIKIELSAITSGVKENVQQYANILFRGEAGSGKTFLAHEFLRNLFGNGYTYQFPSRDNKFSFIFPVQVHQVRGHFVDEVHNIKNIESIYPIMDSQRYIMVFATNLGGDLPEAFTSRCFIYKLDDYTDKEMIEIVVQWSKELKFDLDKETASTIAERARKNPRVAKQYLSRINFIISSGYYPKTVKGVKAAFKDIGVYHGGYTLSDIKYLQFLAKVERASLDTISRALKIDRATILNEIEPFLIERGHISISARGRNFEHWEGANL